MTAKDYVHKLKAGTPGHPILFVFHGTGGDESQFFDFAADLLPQATIVSPRGDVSEHGATRFFRRTGEGIYDMQDLARATSKMAAFAGAFTEAHPSSEVIGLGFSNGANILANLLIETALFHRAVLLHPLIPFPPNPNAALSGKKILITAGRRDPICPPPLTKVLADYFTSQAADVALDWHDGGHEIRQNEVDVIHRFLRQTGRSPDKDDAGAIR